MNPELTHVGVMNLAAKGRLLLALKAFWSVLRGQPAGVVWMGDGSFDRLQVAGPVMLAPSGPEGRFTMDVVEADESVWLAGWDGHRWVRLGEQS